MTNSRNSWLEEEEIKRWPDQLPVLKLNSNFKTSSRQKSRFRGGFTGGFYEIFKGELTTTLPKLFQVFQKISEKGIFLKPFYESAPLSYKNQTKIITKKINYKSINIDAKILNKILVSQIQ